MEAEAEELITLAYPSSTTAVVRRPTAVFLGRRGYTPSSSMVLKGVDAVPYRKIFDRSVNVDVSAATTTTAANSKDASLVSIVESVTETGTGKGGALILATTAVSSPPLSSFLLRLLWVWNYYPPQLIIEELVLRCRHGSFLFLVPFFLYLLVRRNLGYF